VDQYKHFHLSIDRVARTINMGIDYFPHFPISVCEKMIETNLVKGEVIHGIYLGPIHPRSKHKALASKYVWIEAPDGTVIDPIRWALEKSYPHIRIFEPEEAIEFGYQKVNKESEK